MSSPAHHPVNPNPPGLNVRLKTQPETTEVTTSLPRVCDLLPSSELLSLASHLPLTSLSPSSYLPLKRCQGSVLVKPHPTSLSSSTTHSSAALMPASRAPHVPSTLRSPKGRVWLAIIPPTPRLRSAHQNRLAVKNKSANIKCTQEREKDLSLPTIQCPWNAPSNPVGAGRRSDPSLVLGCRVRDTCPAAGSRGLDGED